MLTWRRRDCSRRRRDCSRRELFFRFFEKYSKSKNVEIQNIYIFEKWRNSKNVEIQKMYIFEKCIFSKNVEIRKKYKFLHYSKIYIFENIHFSNFFIFRKYKNFKKLCWHVGPGPPQQIFLDLHFFIRFQYFDRWVPVHLSKLTLPTGPHRS